VIRSRLIRPAPEKRSSFAMSGSTDDLSEAERRLLWRVVLLAVYDWSAPASRGRIDGLQREAERFLFAPGGGLEDFCSVLGANAAAIRRKLKRMGADDCRNQFAMYSPGARYNI
jgi:hypothetical protein